MPHPQYLTRYYVNERGHLVANLAKRPDGAILVVWVEGAGENEMFMVRRYGVLVPKTKPNAEGKKESD